MKAIPETLLAHYASGATTLARLWHIVRKDGQVFAFTDHDEPVTRAGVTYVPSSAFDASAIVSKDDMSVDNLELQGLLATDGITAQDIELGLWDGCAVTLYEVNYNDPEPANILRYGEVGEIQRKPGMFIAEVRGLSQKLQNVIGRIVRASCDAQLGDSRCKVNLEALRVSGSVTAATDARIFSAAGLAQAADYFTFGVVTWVTGANAGRKMEIKQHTAGGGFVLQLDMPKVIAVGDTFTVTPGCNKVGRGPLSTRPVALTSSTFSGTDTGTLPQFFTASITTVVSPLTFRNPDMAHAGPTFAAGLIKWTGGANVGTTSTADRTEADDGTYTLTAATAHPLGVGDTFQLAAAASSGGVPLPTASVGFPATGDCIAKFNNYLNFRGFEDLPGADRLYLYGGQ